MSSVDGIYYSVKNRTYWRVYEPVDGKITMIKLETGAPLLTHDLDVFKQAVDNGTFVYDENQSALIKFHSTIKKPKKKTK